MNRQAKTPLWVYTCTSRVLSTSACGIPLPVTITAIMISMAWRNQSEISFTLYYFQIA